MTRWVLIAFVMILLFLAVWLIRDILMLTLMAIIVALLITTPVRFFMRFGVRRSMAVTITLVLVLLVIVLVGALIVPGLLNQFQQLIVLLQHALLPDTFSIHAPVLDSEHLTVLLRRTLQPGNWAASFDFLRGVDLTNLTKQISTQIFDSIANLPSQVFPFVGSLASVLLGLLVVVFMGLYFVADPGVYERGTLSLFPLNYRPRAQEIMHKLEISLRNFLQAQVILMAITGVGTTVTLVLLGIPLSRGARHAYRAVLVCAQLRTIGRLAADYCCRHFERAKQDHLGDRRVLRFTTDSESTALTPAGRPGNSLAACRDFAGTDYRRDFLRIPGHFAVRPISGDCGCPGA